MRQAFVMKTHMLQLQRGEARVRTIEHLMCMTATVCTPRGGNVHFSISANTAVNDAR